MAEPRAVGSAHTRSSTIITSNKAITEWAQLFGDEVLATAIIDRLLHDGEVLAINGPSWRLRGRGDLLAQTPESGQNSDKRPTDTPQPPRRGPHKGSGETD